VAAADRLTYPASPVWRNPEAALINAAGSVFIAAFAAFASFAAFGVIAVVDGAVAGQAMPVFFGVLWCAAFGFIAWSCARLASRLEFAGGSLSWRRSLPWSPRTRPGRVTAIRWPASSRSRYVRIELDDGRKLSVRPGRGLMEFISSVHEAEPAIVVDVQLSGRARKWTNAKAPGYIQRRIRSAGDNRSVRILLSVVVSLALLGVVAEFGLAFTGPQENFQTLRGDLATVRLPSGYRLTATYQAGTDCAAGPCTLTQTWAWTPGSAHAISAACTDLADALTSAFPRVGSNSPMPAGAACDYYAVLGNLLHPGQGKRTVEGIVRAGHPGINDDFLIVLTASYR
jgi:hypothetical protein